MQTFRGSGDRGNHDSVNDTPSDLRSSTVLTILYQTVRPNESVALPITIAK
jgi:hypothetical protein